eukprot:gene13025-12446_t
MPAELLAAVEALPGTGPLRVALCAKPETPPADALCAATPESDAWKAAYDRFFAAATASAPLRRRSVEWVLDGGFAHDPTTPARAGRRRTTSGSDAGGGPSRAVSRGARPVCVAQRWRPWLVTYVDGRSPAGALTSNDASSGWDRRQRGAGDTVPVWGRYAVLNDNADLSRWEELASADLHYGKFSA